MPPHAEWSHWFDHVWKEAFVLGAAGKQRYYIFVNFILSFVCYPFGREAVRRRSGKAAKPAGAASSIPDFGLPVLDLSGKITYEFILA